MQVGEISVIAVGHKEHGVLEGVMWKIVNPTLKTSIPDWKKRC